MILFFAPAGMVFGFVMWWFSRNRFMSYNGFKVVVVCTMLTVIVWSVQLLGRR